jgi:uncharacterized protein YhaN
MKLERLHIYGYGKLENVELSLSDMTILYGENEAGKSTIRSFIKSILFGFPAKKNRYEPKTGGPYGGAITMQTETYGRIRIERLPKTSSGEVTVYFEDGTQGGEDVLTRLLQGIDASLFESIFSFDMHGLQNIHRVSKEELGNYLFSAGAVGTDLLMRLEKKLEREMDALFKPNGRKPIINSELQEINKLRENVQKWRQKLDAYEELQRKKKDYENRLIHLQIEKTKVQRNIKDYETMRALQPLLIERQKYEDFLKSLSGVSFPADGVERYEALLAQWNPVQDRLQELTQKIESAKKTADEAVIDYEILKSEAFVEECRLQHMSYETAKQEQKLLSSSVKQMKEELEELQSSIGVFGEMELFENMDTSLAAKEAVTQTVHHAQRLADKKQQLDERFASVKEQLEEQEEYVRHVEKQLQTAEARSKGLQAEMKKQAKRKNGNAITNLLGILLVLSTLSIISGVLWKQTVFVLVSIFLFAAAIILFLTNKSKTRKLSDAAQDIELRQIAEQEKFKLQQAEKAYERIVAQYEEWERETYELDGKIDMYKRAYSLPASLSYSQLLGAFERIEKIKRLFRDITKQMERSNLLSRDIEQFERKVQDLKKIFRVTGGSLSTVLHVIYERMKEEIEKNAEKQLLMQKVAEWEEEKQKLLSIHNRLKDERNELWERAAVQKEEEFYERGKVYKEVQEAKKQQSFLLTQISVLAERLTTVQLEDRVTWTENYEELLEQQIQRQTAMQREEQKLQAQLAQYQVEIANLEEGTTYSEILHEWEMKKTKLREQMKKWGAYAAAKAILTKTKEQYHEVRLPRVLETAEQYFRYVTNEKYVRLFAPAAEQSFIAEREDGMRFSAHELSQATAEQLYLSLRLALTDTFDANVPLIVDDSFVHFDRERTERALSLLRIIAKKRQVLFFTCHTHLLPFFSDSETISLHKTEAV